ncbi:hypothetical protein SUDANB120_06672 (plasmid) [Streptomyces sp. enrichment culture]|uniref:hypothetical protein n=1 Tax=Streptomyces sp. enrichment culture TaxID=1795815 RepID=UPI003F546222
MTMGELRDVQAAVAVARGSEPSSLGSFGMGIKVTHLRVLTDLGIEVSDFLDVPMREVVQSVGGRTTRIGVAWNAFSDLKSIRDLILNSIFSADPQFGSADSFADLLGQAFGEIPSRERVQELRWTRSVDSAGRRPASLVVFGAYVLSAGAQPTGVGDARPVDAFGLTPDDIVCFDPQVSDPRSHISPLARLAVLAEAVAVWCVNLLALLQEWLSPAAYECTEHPPPVASSPCGVIRMASPEVPRGPQLDLHLDAVSPYWVLAA